MNLTLPDYFRLVSFQRLSTKEQVIHLLFFVTVVAELRDDMVAQHIANRIKSKKNDVSPDEVQAILESDHYHFDLSAKGDFSDRLQHEKAYHLTERAKKELIKEANVKFAKVRFWAQPGFLIPLVVAFAAAIAGVGLFAFHVFTYADVSDVSWTTYKQRLVYEQEPPEEKAKYLLYFITHQIKFRPDMTADVAADRLNDLGDGPVQARMIKEYFEKEKETFLPSTRSGAFIMTKKGIQEVKERLSLVPSGDSGILNHKWFMEYEWARARLIVPFWIATLSMLWSAGFLCGKVSLMTEKMIQE